MNDNLITIKIDRNKNYSTISLLCLEDKRLSWKAKGIHIYFMSRPDHWVINSSDLQNRSTDGPTSLYSGIKELIQNKYLFRIIKRNEKRQIIKWGYLATEIQQSIEYAKKILFDSGWELYKPNIKDQEKLETENINIENKGYNIYHNSNKQSLSFLNKFKKDKYKKSPEEDFSDTPPFQESLPVRKFKRPPIETKQKPSLKENNKHYEEIGNKLRSNINNKIAAEKPMKPKAVPQQRVPEEIVDIMDLWHQLGFKKINPEKAPKTFNKTVSALKKIQKGTLIPGEKRKFSIEEIKDSIAKYSLIALDPEYGPDNPEIKKAMGNKSLEAFLYCSGFGSKGNKVLSWCVKCIDDPPLSKKTTIENVEEKYPRITKIFKRFYCDHVLCGMNKKFSANDESKFKKAANRIGDAYFKLDRVLHGVRDPEHLASLFCQSVAKSFGTNISKIYPGSMGSDFAIERLLAFLQEKEMIENRARENFNKIF